MDNVVRLEIPGKTNVRHEGLLGRRPVQTVPPRLLLHFFSVKFWEIKLQWDWIQKNVVRNGFINCTNAVWVFEKRNLDFYFSEKKCAEETEFSWLFLTTLGIYLLFSTNQPCRGREKEAWSSVQSQFSCLDPAVNAWLIDWSTQPQLIFLFFGFSFLF